MKLKNLLLLALTAFLLPSLYAQKENPEIRLTKKMGFLNEPYSRPFRSMDHAHNKGKYDLPAFEKSTRVFPAGIDPVLVQQLQDVLDSAIIEYNIKGLSAALSAPNGDIWKGASGISHDTVAVTTDMLFGIGSITKTFIAAIIMQLYEADSLKLSDSIYNWLPSFENIDSTVTIRQLLDHTSGIYNITDHPGYIDSVAVPGSRIWTPEEILETFVLSPDFPPGTDWDYSNTNYILLGMIIEEITGNEVATELHERITIPLGLNSTFLFPDEAYEGVRSHAWWVEGNSIIDFTTLVDTSAYSAIWTAGGLLSTAEDLVKWSKGLNEEEILNDATLELMRVPAPYSEGCFGPGTWYGLGTMLELLDSEWRYGHGGNYVYTSELFYVPEESLSIAVMSNQRIPPVGNIWLDLYSVYMDFVTSEIEYHQPDPVQVYPNPVKDITSFSSEEVTAFELYTPTGTLMIRRNSNTVDMSHLEPGMYFVVGFDKNGNPLYTGKIVKK